MGGRRALNWRSRDPVRRVVFDAAPRLKEQEDGVESWREALGQVHSGRADGKVAILPERVNSEA